MKIINQLLDYSTPWTLPNVYLFTGNPVIKNNGAIVMGRGAAKQVRDSYLNIDIAFGNAIQDKPDNHIVWVILPNNQYIGWFKVKEHWANPAIISVIQESIDELRIIADKNLDLNFHMNYPGVGNGKLDVGSVQHMLEVLPENIFIYQ